MTPDQIAALAGVLFILTAALKQALDVDGPWVVLFTILAGPLLAVVAWTTGWFPGLDWRECVAGGWMASTGANGLYSGGKALIVKGAVSPIRLRRTRKLQERVTRASSGRGLEEI